MKKDIHPKVNTECVVTCACGNSFVTISTLPSIKVEICSMCHPFFTGNQKFVDTEGRIDKFERRRKVAQEKKNKAEKLKAAKETKKVPEVVHKTVKEVLDEFKKESEKEDQETK